MGIPLANPLAKPSQVAIGLVLEQSGSQKDNTEGNLPSGDD